MELVQKIKTWAMKNYDEGGHWIVETFEDDEIAESFVSLDDAISYCKHLQARQDELRGWAW